MSSKYPDIQTTVQQYVLGKLSEIESDEFEAYFLSQPDIIEMVELEQTFQAGLQASESHAQIGEEPSSTAVHTTSWLSKLGQLVSIPIPAYAVAALAAISFLSFNPLETQNQTSSLDFELARFSTAVKRGEESQVSINFSEYDNAVGLFIKLQEVTHRDYKVTLVSTDSGEISWESEPFQVSSLKDQLVVIPNGVVTGDQIIEVAGINSGGENENVRFCNYSEPCR